MLTSDISTKHTWDARPSLTLPPVVRPASFSPFSFGPSSLFSSSPSLPQFKHQLISPSKRAGSRIAGKQFLREFAKFAETWIGLGEGNELWLVSNLFRNSIRQKVRAPSSPWVSVRALSPTGSAGQPARRLRVGSTPNLSHIRVHEP